MNTKQKGDITEIKIIAHLLSCGYTILQPIGDRNRFDFVVYIEKGGEVHFSRIQCKTGKIRNGVIEVIRKSTYLDSNGKSILKYYTPNEIEYIMIYEPTNEMFYLIDINDPVTKLRVEEPKRKNKNIKYAKDYEFNGFISHIVRN